MAEEVGGFGVVLPEFLVFSGRNGGGIWRLNGFTVVGGGGGEREEAGRFDGGGSGGGGGEGEVESGGGRGVKVIWAVEDDGGVVVIQLRLR